MFIRINNAVVTKLDCRYKLRCVWFTSCLISLSRCLTCYGTFVYV